MISPVVFLTDIASVADIVIIVLMTNKHGGYPIVEYSGRGLRNNGSGAIPLYRGTISRLHLISILEHIFCTNFYLTTRRSQGVVQLSTYAVKNGQYVGYRYLEKIHVKYPLHKNGRVLTTFLLADEKLFVLNCILI